MKAKYYINADTGAAFSDRYGQFYMKRTKTKWSAHYFKTGKIHNVFDKDDNQVFDSFVTEGAWKEVKI